MIFGYNSKIINLLALAAIFYFLYDKYTASNFLPDVSNMSLSRSEAMLKQLEEGAKKGGLSITQSAAVFMMKKKLQAHIEEQKSIEEQKKLKNIANTVVSEADQLDNSSDLGTQYKSQSEVEVGKEKFSNNGSKGEKGQGIGGNFTSDGEKKSN